MILLPRFIASRIKFITLMFEFALQNGCERKKENTGDGL